MFIRIWIKISKTNHNNDYVNIIFNQYLDELKIILNKLFYKIL